MARTRSHSHGLYNSAASKHWTKPIFISAAALMAGALAPASAQAQCSGGAQEYFPLGSGSGVNALTSVISTVNTAFLNNGSAFVSAPAAGPNQQGGGVWARTIGGTVETQSDGQFNGSWTLPGSPSNTVESSCRTKVEQDFAGFQVGHDIALLNAGGAGLNWHTGVLAGYVGADFRDATPGGTLTGNFNVPFAGVYTALSLGNFYADGQARFDYFQGELSDPDANNVWNQRLDAHGYSLTGNVGYRISLGGAWSLEPSVGGVLSHTKVDPLHTSGTRFPLGTGTSFNGTWQMANVDSEIVRGSLKLGTSVASPDGRLVMYPFVSGSVFREFADDVTASVSSPGLRIKGDLTVDRVDAYALLSAGSAFHLVDTGWLGYVRVDYRTGEDIEGVSVNAGLRYQFNPDMASLKDGGSLKDAPAERYSWTGPYVGVSVGGTSGTSYWPGAPYSFEADNAGILGGGQAGLNYQIGPIVLGVEGDIGLSDARGAASCSSFSTLVDCEDNVETLGSVTGRVGVAVGRALIYGKGGWGFGEVSVGEHVNIYPGNLLPGVPMPSAGSDSQWLSGWTVGGGIEFALTDRLSAKAEYMHYELPTTTFSVRDNYNPAIGFNGDYVLVGLNYHLTGGAH